MGGSFGNLFEGQLRGHGEYRRSGDSEVREHDRPFRNRRARLVEKLRIRKRQAREFATPRLERNECGERRRELGHGVSERTREGVSSPVGSGIGVRGGACRKNDRVEILKTNDGRMRKLDRKISLIPTYRNDLRTEPEVSPGKRSFENRDDVRSFVGCGKGTEIVLYLDFATVGSEPFARFFRRKRSKRALDELGSPRILRKDIFLRRNASRNVAPSSSRNGDFLPHSGIPLEKRYGSCRNALFNHRCRGHHSGGSGSYHRDFHIRFRLRRHDIREKANEKRKRGFRPYFALLCQNGSLMCAISWRYGGSQNRRSWFSVSMASSSATSFGNHSRS